MGYVAIDPSYSRTGLALYEDGVLVLTYLAKEAATEKDYQSMFHRVESMTDRIITKIHDYVSISKVISEEPLPNATFSSGLFALDTVLFHKLMKLDELDELYNVHPSYLVHIHKKRGYTKSDSVNKAKEFISIYEKMGIRVVLDPKRLAHDTAEALIFLTRLLVLDNVQFNGLTFKNEFKNYLELMTQKEKLLYRKGK